MQNISGLSLFLTGTGKRERVQGFEIPLSFGLIISGESPGRKLHFSQI